MTEHSTGCIQGTAGARTVLCPCASAPPPQGQRWLQGTETRLKLAGRYHGQLAHNLDATQHLGLLTACAGPWSFPRTNRYLLENRDAFHHINTDFCDVIEQGAAAVLASIPKPDASHLRTEGVTMEASCTILVLGKTTENSIYYYEELVKGRL